MGSPNRSITLSFSVHSGGSRETTAPLQPGSAQTPLPAAFDRELKENMRPPDEPRPKTFMDNWIEPPLRPPAPSFTDDPHLRIERHGVLAGMAPLGTMPPAKLKKAAKQQEELSRQTMDVDDSDASTIAGTPREMRTPEPPINTIIRRSYSKEEDAGERNPHATASARKSASKTPRPREAIAHPSESPVAIRDAKYLEQTDKAVQFAVEDAILNRRWPTAYALRTLYNEHKINPRIQRLFMVIFTGQATDVERREFGTMITWKKRHGAKDHTAQKYFDQNDNSYTPHPFLTSFTPRSSTMKDKAEAIDRGASTSTPTSPHKDTSTHAPKKAKVDHDDRLLQRTSYSEPITKPKSTTNGVSATKNITTGQPHQGRNHATHSPRTEYDSDAISAGNMPQTYSPAARPRASSISSSSSLSSLDEAILGGLDSPIRSVDLRVNEAAKAREVSERKAANSAEKPGHDHNERQPITRHDEHVHKPNNFTAVNSASSSNTPTPNPPDSSSSTLHRNSDNGMRPSSAEPYSLPPALPSILPQRPPVKSNKKSASSIAAAVARKAGSFNSRDADISNRKKKVKSRAEEEYRQARDSSFVRTPVSIPEPESEREAASTTTVAPSAQPQIKPILRFRTRPAGDDSDVQSSPTRLTFRLDFQPESAKNSRASTPTTGTSRVSRKARNPGPRMKSSPKKKPFGPLGGVARNDSQRQYSPSAGENGQQDDNEDFCSSCGGSGDLVCCDGCVRSFHLRCVDPPMDLKDLPDEWFCNVCVSHRKGTTAHSGLFGKLMNQLEMSNPHPFHLPKEVREAFDGVRTGPDGEYEDSPPPKRGKHEEQDLLRLYDKRGEPVLCHVCSAGSGGSKPIITCTYCQLSWHLDCLDPPLANAPGNGPTRPWKCPCHVDDVLGRRISESLGPAHKFRKIKGKAPIKPDLQRGVRNEGHIEIELATSEDEHDGDFFEEREFGRVYVLPEEGIKLDFISRVHQIRHESGKEVYPDYDLPILARAAPLQKPMDEHTLDDQQAALNLAALCSRRNSETDSIKALTDAMVAGLSGTGAIEIIAKGSVAKLIGNEDEATDADLAMLDAVIEMGKQAETIKRNIFSRRIQNGAGDGDVDMDREADEDVVLVKQQPRSSPAPAPGDEALAPRPENGSLTGPDKRKLRGKDGLLAAGDAENMERAKRSRSR